MKEQAARSQLHPKFPFPLYPSCTADKQSAYPWCIFFGQGKKSAFFVLILTQDSIEMMV
jgi:hypothetical protein